MAVTIYRKIKNINRITIINGKEKEENTAPAPRKEVNARIRGKMYGRRTVKQN